MSGDTMAGDQIIEGTPAEAEEFVEMLRSNRLLDE
jgi:hypothetical protein